MISESRLLISFDPLTSLIHESTLLGTPVYIYDETFKEEYDKFNFKLHGFYYNLKDSDLTRVYKESFNLAERAHNEIKDLSNSQHVRTSELIIKIENHFSDNKTCYEKYTSNQKKDIDFFKKNFGLIPIFNIGTERNIVRYHIINKYKIFGILLFLTFRLLRKIKNFKFKINLRQFKELFTSEESL